GSGGNIVVTMAQIDRTTNKAPAALRNAPSRTPRSESVATIATAKISAPPWVKTSASSIANTNAMPLLLLRAQQKTARVGQNKACAIHSAVGKPKTSGQRQAVERQAKPKMMRLRERSAANVAVSPSSGATKKRNP